MVLVICGRHLFVPSRKAGGGRWGRYAPDVGSVARAVAAWPRGKGLLPRDLRRVFGRRGSDLAREGEENAGPAARWLFLWRLSVGGGGRAKSVCRLQHDVLAPPRRPCTTTI